MVVREIIPGSPVFAIILAHGSPGPFAEIRPPVFSVSPALVMGNQALVFGSLFQDDILYFLEILCELDG
jgi:hypothetical protein